MSGEQFVPQKLLFKAYDDLRAAWRRNLDLETAIRVATSQLRLQQDVEALATLSRAVAGTRSKSEFERLLALSESLALRIRRREETLRQTMAYFEGASEAPQLSDLLGEIEQALLEAGEID